MKKIKKFDILLMAIIIAVLVVLGLKFSALKELGPGGQSVNYEAASVEFVIEGVRVMTTDALHVGDTVYSNETNNEIGKIKEVNIAPYVDNITKVDGSIVPAEVPDKYTITLVVETELSKRNTGYFAYGITEIKTNSEAVLYTKYVKVISTVGGINFEQ